MSRHRTQRGLYLSHKMYNAYPNSFCGAIISGTRGIGKSSFALNAVWELYRLLGYDEDEAWNKTLEVCKFTMDDVIDFIEKSSLSDQKEHVLLWDDAGVYASTMEWWANRDTLRRLKGVLDTIRTGVCSLILTTPQETDLTKVVRNYDDYIIQIRYTEGGNYRMAKGYLKRTLPSGKVMIYPKFKNKFLVMLPDSVFDKYMAMRKNILEQQIQKIKQSLKDAARKEKMDMAAMQIKMKKLQDNLKKIKEGEHGTQEEEG